MHWCNQINKMGTCHRWGSNTTGSPFCSFCRKNHATPTEHWSKPPGIHKNYTFRYPTFGGGPYRPIATLRWASQGSECTVPLAPFFPADGHMHWTVRTSWGYCDKRISDLWSSGVSSSELRMKRFTKKMGLKMRSTPYVQRDNVDYGYPILR